MFINSLAKGLKVLSIFTEKEKELSLTEISQRLNMSKGSIQRVTYTLTSLGYLEKNEETKKYQLGLKVLTLGFTLL
ncbi:MAG: helix-turn-helix domain-containing protein, partial [Deltaproteobacteria bacterium]|nr:helix-turn-helix domain-containing protein [Deltaproteobacteria bacterium]